MGTSGKGIAVAVTDHYLVPKFNASWYQTMVKYSRQLQVVSLDLLKDEEQRGLSDEILQYSRSSPDVRSYCQEMPAQALDAFVIGRNALLMTAAMQVVSLGGDAV